MNAILSLVISSGVVGGLVAIAFAGVWLAPNAFGVPQAAFEWLFGVVIPYFAVIVFFVGIIYKVVQWGKLPVPFRIPSTCAQQKSLPWIKYGYAEKLDNPVNNCGVIGRMILEVLCFRSLFRNSRMEYGGGGGIRYKPAKWLWLAAIVFHYTFLVVILRHLRFFNTQAPQILHRPHALLRTHH
jgi:nitrate reductase gamma subunit